MAGIYDLSGVSTVIENLADHLGKRGLDVTIGALKFNRIPPKGKYNVETIPLFNLLKLRRFLNSFDILHSHHPLTNYLAFISNKPFIYHYHGSPDYKGENLFRLHMFLSIKIMKHALDAVISVSESGAEELKQHFNLDEVYIIYNGVNINRFKPGLEEKFREGKPQFLFVGNLYEHKKVDELVTAFKDIILIYPEAHLQIIGRGDTYTHLGNLIRKFHLQDHVTLTGRVSDSALPYYYSSSDVYVTTSRWELFGLPLLEAMACGKPVVASSIPPHIELVTKSKAGVIYKIGDIEYLKRSMIKTYDERNKYKKYALIFSKKCGWSIIANHILNIYYKTLNDLMN